MTALHLPQTAGTTGATTFALRLENLDAITSAYGEDSAEFVLNSLISKARALAYTALIYRSTATIIIYYPDFTEKNLRYIEYILMSLSNPISFDGNEIIPVLSASRDDGQGAGLPGQTAPATSDLYREDMRAAVLASEAMAHDRLVLLYQPVTTDTPLQDVLYNECLVRIAPPDVPERLIAPGSFIPALERLGAIRALDCFVMRQVIDVLRNDPGVTLGCNVSSLSTIADIWWEAIFADLAAAPDVASRLIVEITESAKPESVEQTLQFVKAMRRLGCRIAIDDFGIGYSSIGLASAIRPDIIKVDGTFASLASDRAFGPNFLRSLIEIASCLCPCVVLEGIEDQPAQDRALRAGAHWLQGYLFGQPFCQPHPARKGA